MSFISENGPPEAVEHEPIEKPPLIEQTETVVTRWWITPATEQDVYYVFVARYHSKERIDQDAPQTFRHEHSTPWAEYLNNEGYWRVTPEGEVIEPALVLPGQMLHILSVVGILDPHTLAEALTELAVQITNHIMPQLLRKVEVEEVVNDAG